MDSAVKLYNSLSKKVEPFEPITPGKVTMYHCGPTVYKRQHIGNMRRFLFADFLARALRFWGYDVHEVMNITDVGHLTQDDIDEGEDKLEVAARAQHVDPLKIADDQIALFRDDLTALNIESVDEYPRATDHIKEMQAMIAKLLERGHAYEASSGVYYDVQSFPEYGKLSGNTPRKIAAGSRVAVRAEKKHPADFALWKTDDSEHLQQWDSPWGRGYPGWHIECSAMSRKYLGDEFDIHTSGEDNRFPHHENEIAQSEGVTGSVPARFWLYNGHLMLTGQKLAKSKGEQLTLDTLTARGFSPLAFRLLVFGSHYRSKLDFSWEALSGAQENLSTLRHMLRRLREVVPSVSKGESDTTVITAFGEALADDLNTAAALAVVLAYVSTINTQLADGSLSESAARTVWATLYRIDAVFGIITPLVGELDSEEAPQEIAQLASDREAARVRGDFAEADRLRDQITSQGWHVEDTDTGPRLIPT